MSAPNAAAADAAAGDAEHKYFALLPHALLAYCRTPYDLALWVAVKVVAGEDGVCTLSTPALADLAGISVGKAAECRNHLLRVGLLAGSLHRDAAYPQSVWHLRVPDLWRRNAAWRREAGDGLYDRIEAICHQRQSLREGAAAAEEEQEQPSNKWGISPGEGGPSPGERGPSPHERGPSPGETKKNLVEPNKKEEGNKTETPAQIWETVRDLLRWQLPAATYRSWLERTAGLSRADNVLTVAVETERAREWLTIRLQPRVEAELARVTGEKLAVRWVVGTGESCL